MSCHVCDLVSTFSAGVRTHMYFSAFFGYLAEQVAQVLGEYGYTVGREGLMYTIESDDAPGVIERLATDGRFSVDERANINVMVLRAGEKPDVENVSLMKPLVQWFRIVSAVDLVAVIKEKALKVAFQPIVSMGSWEVYGYECLSRGVARDGSILRPDALFHQARDLDLVFNLDRVVRENALAAIHAAGHPGRMFINFMPNAVYDPEYCLRTTMRTARKLGISRDRIVFEIVESESVTDVDHLRTILTYYQSQGVMTALDDVGSGYSSLKTLAALRPDIMKLDMELIRGIHKDKLKQSIFGGLEQIAADNGILLLAEGVETEEELGFLERRNVDLVQGYYFSRPLDQPEYSVPKELRSAQVP